jgi:small-conductance mechanosensitive channel
VRTLLLLAVLLAMAAPAAALELRAPADAEAAPGSETTLAWTFSTEPGRNDTLALATVELPAGSDWTATVTPPEARLAGGESTTFLVRLQAAEHPTPRRVEVTLQVLAVTDGQAITLRATATVAATGHTLVLDTWKNPLPAPFDGVAGVFLLDVVAWLAIAYVVRVLVGPLLRVATRRTRTTADDAVVAILGGPLFAILFAFGVKQSLGAFDLPDWLFALLDRLYVVFVAACVVYILYRLWHEVLLIYGRRVAGRTGRGVDQRLLPVLEKIGGVFIVLGGLFYAISTFGIDLTYFAAGGVLVTTVIAFAAQDTLSNFFGGIFLLVDQPFREGDDIVLESGEACVVRRIGLRSTRLYHPGNHEMIIVPNNQLASRRVVNLVKPDRRCKVKVEASVTSASGFAKSRDAMLEAANAHPKVLHGGEMEPHVAFARVGPTLDVVLTVWIADIADRGDVASDLRAAVLDRFSRHGVELPPPMLAPVR